MVVRKYWKRKRGVWKRSGKVLKKKRKKREAGPELRLRVGLVPIRSHAGGELVHG
jgi:hypothetical protein